MLEDSRQRAAPPLGTTATKWLIRLGATGTALGFLYFALRDAPFQAIWATLQPLRPSQVLLILAVDAVTHGLIAARWWIIARAQSRGTDYPSLLSARLAAFAISYFTAGPQIGGEPLQVMYLRRHHGWSYARAVATVVLDKLLELLANFLFLLVGLIALVQAGVFGARDGSSLPLLAASAVLLAWPLIHVVLLWRGRYPLSRVLRVMAGRGQGGRGVRFVQASEHLAGRFCQRKPGALFASAMVSLLGNTSAVIEYLLITSFLGIHLGLGRTIAAWTAGQLSFLVPLPAGLGALEASQVFVLGLFGASAVSAIGVTMLMRGRDLIAGALGLLLVAPSVGRRKSMPALKSVVRGVNEPDELVDFFGGS